MLQIQNLTYEIGDRLLLDKINWQIKPGRRIGLIGPNGAGKTTFLRHLANILPTAPGVIKFPKYYRIGYLPQEEIKTGAQSLLNLVLQGNEEIMALEAEIQSIHKQLEQGENGGTIIKRLGHLEDRFRILGGYNREAEAKRILQGLGFKESDYNRDVLEFSGGWRMRGHLARLLLQAPDLLLMDEPTNHLDLASLEWLEEFLKTFKGSMIIVSHDRFFLDRLANEIAELANGKITHYNGNYHFYEKKRAELREQQHKAFLAQKSERERIEKFIERFRYKATKAAQVQSRIKMLEKMPQAVDIESETAFSFQIKADVKSYKNVLSISEMAFAYGPLQVFKNFNLDITRGEKLALVGANGEGKTTLTRLICGELSPQNGNINIGERVNIGYYAQHQTESLDVSKTIYQEVESSAAPSFRARLRDILGLFRFHGDEINKKIAVLSGGEKARVSLAKILLSPCNFLIMDEPTNHLDTASKQALENALRHYDGTLLIISHDRYFLDSLVERVLEIKQGKLYDYPGNYSYYLDKRLQYTASVKQQHQSPEKTNAPANTTRKSKEQKRLEAEARKAVSKERNRLQKRIDSIEKRLDEINAQREQLEKEMADPQTYNNPERSAALNKNYKSLEKEEQELEGEWEEKQLELDALLESITVDS